MAGKKNGDYEKPESHDVKGDELEDISGGEGSQGNQCTSGNQQGPIVRQVATLARLAMVVPIRETATASMALNPIDNSHGTHFDGPHGKNGSPQGVVAPAPSVETAQMGPVTT